ncbi:MAG: hypothetical protein Unbinned8138contig1000_38 [Prokaryotic dsDNA virus sp.]|nr:MAG: hypothetical protein Unbinned8138contig1000_38 [Prokaryotic dsDNA virus sp.]|tara:strand:+ start:1368 stop:2117 length:750 start_codon:yes stop_codon:yes gene_type:complete
MKKNTLVDVTYKLKREATPLSLIIQSKSTKRQPLLWFDNDTGQNRELRYARNQNSPFVDEQDGNVILEPVEFIDGFLHVKKENQALQKFLECHPALDKIYVRVDKAKDAADIVEDLNLEVDALIMARELDIEQIEAITKVAFGTDPSTITSSELRRDILIFAKDDPKGFMALAKDASLSMDAKVKTFIDKSILTFRKNKSEVYFNTPTNKKRMLVIPFGDDPVHSISSYLQSDEGLETLSYLDKILETK